MPAVKTKQSDTSYHDRRLARRLKEDPEFRAEFQRQRRAIAQIDAVVRQLDRLRERAGLSKAELARQVGKDPASIRRLFTAEVNPELKTVAAVASALGAEVKIVTRRRSGTRKSSRRPRKATVAA
jgi:ribosome-binding protein aMBF1 (putative translation factor)